MPAFITLTDANIADPAFWAAIDLTAQSTLDASGVRDGVDITITGGSISFFDTVSGTTTTYTDADLASGSFSELVQYTGNDGDSTVSGNDGLNGTGFVGGSGNDTLTDSGTNGGGLTGGAGDDVLQGGVGSNEISGGDGDDVLRGGGGNNNLYGGAGNDTLFAEEGSGNLIGGDGDDTIYAGLNTTFVQGGAGTNTMILPEGATFAPFSPGSTAGQVTLPDGRTFVYTDVASDDISIACLTAGTTVSTPRGNVPVEALRPGDLVDTLDHGPRPVRWIGVRTVAGHGALAPVRFAKGSIGNARPMRLSPQHRVLRTGWRCEVLFGEREVLVAAKHLCDGDAIRVAPCDAVTYIHVMFDRHEIVRADGALVESFFVGDYITDAERGGYDELIRLFPELARQAHPARRAARPFARAFEGRLLA